MAGIPENAAWENEVYQIEQADPVVGGPPDLGQGQGITNVPHQHLANRTAWLKAQIEALQDTLGGLSYATQSDIDAAISALIDGAPGALDTLNELAAAMTEDANFAASVTASLAGKLAQGMNLSDLGDPDAALTNLGLTDEAKTLISTGRSVLYGGDWDDAPDGAIINSGQTDDNSAATKNHPDLGGTTQARWFEGRTQSGVFNRKIQWATEVFGIGTTRGRVFVRVKHDNTWYPWREIGATHDQSVWDAGVATEVASVSPAQLKAAVLAQIGPALAGVGYGAIGSYVFASHNVAGAAILAGATVAGSDLRAAGIVHTNQIYGTVDANVLRSTGNDTASEAYQSIALSGTWRAEGVAVASGASTYATTLWKRIA